MTAESAAASDILTAGEGFARGSCYNITAQPCATALACK
jgi:hypothetical protein